MKKTLTGLTTAVLLSMTLPPAHAQLEVGGDLLDNCSRIDELQKNGKYSEARNLARLCLEGLDQKLEGEVGEYFLEDVAGWKRTRLEQNKTMGLSITTARYEKGGVSADVSLTGGAGSGAGLGALGGFGGLAAMGMLQSGRQVRVGGLPAAVNPDGTILVTLEDGSFLSFKSRNYNDADSALEGIGPLVNEFPVADINRTLVKGNK
jgi:hypothetical protein